MLQLRTNDTGGIKQFSLTTFLHPEKLHGLACGATCALHAGLAHPLDLNYHKQHATSHSEGGAEVQSALVFLQRHRLSRTPVGQRKQHEETNVPS